MQRGHGIAYASRHLKAHERKYPTGDLHRAIVEFLSGTPSKLFVLNQEDIFKDTDQQNLPGTTAEYPNWRHKMKFALGELRSGYPAGCAAMFRDCLARSGRLA